MTTERGGWIPVSECLVRATQQSMLASRRALPAHRHRRQPNHHRTGPAPLLIEPWVKAASVACGLVPMEYCSKWLCVA